MLAKHSSAAMLSVATTLPSDTCDTFAAKLSGDRWHVAQTQLRAEGVAIIHLERQGLRVFCPRFRKTVRHARKAKSFLIPPNYLFLNLDTTRELRRAVDGTRGVVRVVSQDTTSAPLPHEVVVDLLAKAGTYNVMDWKPMFKIGQAVRVAEGPFADLVGKLEYLNAARRVGALIDLLGRHVSVALRCEALIAAA